MKCALFAAVFVVAGCNPVQRTIATSVIDQTSGTAYAFEVDDPRRGSDYIAVIVCNPEFPRICYRIMPAELTDADQIHAAQAIIRSVRGDIILAQQRALAASRPQFTYDGTGSIDGPTSAGGDTGSTAPRTIPQED